MLRRGILEIKILTLEAISRGNESPFHISCSAKLNHKQCSPILEEFERRGLVWVKVIGKRTFYRLSAKGLSIIPDARKVRRILMET